MVLVVTVLPTTGENPPVDLWSGLEITLLDDVSSPLGIVDGSVVVSSPPLDAVFDDPRVVTGALARTAGGRSQSLGVLRVDASDRAAAAAVVRALPEPGDDPVLQIVEGLQAAGITVTPVEMGGYVWARPATETEIAPAERARAALDERRVRLREAARGGDGFYSTFVLRKLSWRVTGLAERAGLTPNQVTIASFLLGLAAAALIATGDRPAMVAGALLLQVCLVVDCVDGELARYRRRFSRFGAWLDATTDRVKEFAGVAAFAVAGWQVGLDLWWLAAAAIGLQTFRNLLDLGWAIQREAALEVTGPARGGIAPSTHWVKADRALLTPARKPGPGVRYWARRVGHFPIGERFLLMSIGAAVLPPRLTLNVLIVLGVLAAAYLLAAFVLRARSSSASARALARLADTGPLLGALIVRLTKGRATRVAAVLPAVLAVVELGLTWCLAVWLAGAEAWVGLLLVGAVAVAHYQQAYGVREARATSGPLLGTDGRLVLLAVLALVVRGFDPPVPSLVTAGLAAVVVIASTTYSLRVWLAPSPTASSPTAGSATASESSLEPTMKVKSVGGAR